MPFIAMTAPAVDYVGMQLNDTKEQAAELCSGFEDAGVQGLLLYAYPRGYVDGQGEWHWRIIMQMARDGMALGPELEGNEGDWIIVGIVQGVVREILLISDADRIARGLQVA